MEYETKIDKCCDEFVEDYLMPGLPLDRDYLSQLLGQKLTIPDWTIGVWEKLK